APTYGDGRDDCVGQGVNDEGNHLPAVIPTNRDRGRLEELALTAVLVEHRGRLVDVLRQGKILMHRASRGPLGVAHVARYLHRDTMTVREDLDLVFEASKLRRSLEIGKVDENNVCHVTISMIE